MKSAKKATGYYCGTQAGEVLYQNGMCGVLPKASTSTGVSQHWHVQ